MFIVSSFAPLSFGTNIDSREQTKTEDYNFEYYLYPEYVAREKYPELFSQSEKDYNNEDLECLKNENLNPSPTNIIENPVQSLNGPMDSAWPMYGQDIRHTGRSIYNSSDNPGYVRWLFDTSAEARGGTIIDNEGMIYIGADNLFAVYPNGTKKWEYDTPFIIVSTPAIDENGIIYIATDWETPNYLFAINSSNGKLKWKYKMGWTWSSPNIGDDGTIYIGDFDDNLHAIYPNGTRKWVFNAGQSITSSPGIGLDGTIYFGSIDDHVYALYPNNGTVRWKYNTGSWVHGTPTIEDDGTVYIGSDNGNLYAFYPNNGTIKWHCPIGSVWGSPVLDENGILYVGVYEEKFYAIYPNGTIKWVFDDCDEIWWTSASISNDDIIYFGSNRDIHKAKGGDLISLNPDGTERWRIEIASDYIMSPPAIGEDGILYVGSWNNKYQSGTWGCLNAIGPFDPDAPTAPVITGQTSGIPDKEYEYKFKSTSPVNRDIYYYINMGDNTIKNWFGPFSSGEEIAINHTYTQKKTYIIKSQAKDTDNRWGPWAELEVIIPRDKGTSYSFFLQFLERFPLLKQLFSPYFS